MGKSKRTMRHLVFVSCFPLFVAACGEKPAETPVQPRIVTQKISIQKESVATPKPSQPEAAKPAVDTAATVQEKSPPSESGAVKAEAAQTVAAPALAVPQPVVAGQTGTPVKTEAPAEEIVKPEADSETALAYIPAGKVDPFAPLFREQPVAVAQAEEAAPSESEGQKPAEKKKKRVPRTPLEKMDLSQLKLVGIIRSDLGNKALVQDAAGKGYVLEKGTYIGINAGFVTEITRDKVIVEEEVEDLYGKVSLRERELVLQKPVGDI